MAEDGDDIQGNIQEERSKIIELQSEQFRKQEQLERLRLKTKALEEELSTREAELADLQAKFSNESRQGKVSTTDKAKDKAKSTATTAAENAFITQEVRRLLQDRIPAMAAISEERDEDANAGFADETVKLEDAGKQHETVLVKYIYRSESKIMLDYQVTYRIDGSTTVAQLHKDACAYWGCSHTEYVLFRLDDKDTAVELTTPTDALQPLLPLTEEAKLHLIKKECVKEYERQIKDNDKQAKEKKMREQQATQDTDDRKDTYSLKTLQFGLLGGASESQEEPFVNAFRQWPGVYKLLRGRSRSREYHQKWQYVPCSDFFCFSVLIVLTCLVINFRNVTDLYALTDGVMQSLVHGIEGETSANVTSVFLRDSFDSRQALMWTGATSGVSWSKSSVLFQGENQSIRAQRAFSRYTRQVTVSAALALNAPNCSDYFMMFSPAADEVWPASSDSAVEFIWNCRSLTISTPANSSIFLLPCNFSQHYQIRITLDFKGSISFSDETGCNNVTALRDLTTLFGTPFFLYIGADDADNSSAFEGINVTLVGPQDIMRFEDIRLFNDIWKWLSGSFHYQVFDGESSLRKYYTPVGFMRIRQQRAKIRDCQRDAIPYNLQRTCHYVLVTEESADTAEIPNEGWDQGLQLREAVPDPRQWQPRRLDVADKYGYIQHSYDGSGYIVDYRLSPAKLLQGPRFLAEFDNLRQFWVSTTTRMLTIEMTLANYNLGGYVAATFLIEISPSGAIATSYRLSPFQLSDSFGKDVATGLDSVRWIIIIGFIMTIRVYTEGKRKVAIGKSGLNYIFSFFGIVDMLIVGLFFAIQYMRFKDGPPSPADLQVFFSYSQTGETENQLSLAESSLAFLLFFRFATLMRLFPAVFRFFKMFARSLVLFAWFLAMFLPVFFGTMFCANAIWSPSVRSLSTWAESLYTVLLALEESFDVTTLHTNDKRWTVAFLTYFFLSTTAFFIHMFLAITVHSYFEVELTEGSDPDAVTWNRDQWLDWMLWPPLYSKLTGNKPGSSRNRGSADRGPEGDEEASDDDDEADAKRE